jgi:hypothetical protein
MVGGFEFQIVCLLLSVVGVIIWLQSLVSVLIMGRLHVQDKLIYPWAWIYMWLDTFA